MNIEEPELFDIEIKEHEISKLSTREGVELTAFSKTCKLGRTFVSANDRMGAMNQSIADHPLFTVVEHKKNFPLLFAEMKSRAREAIRIVKDDEIETAGTSNNVKNAFETDKHAKLKLAIAKRRSQKKQRDTNSASNIKNKQHKVDTRAAHNVLRDSPGEIICLLSEQICNRKNHKDRGNHNYCPFLELFRINKGKCIRIINIE